MGFVRRYTNLAGAIHILETKQLTLLDPSNWDDGNDRYFMDCYKTGVEAKSVAALCFAQASETYHHWKVFSAGSDGICIKFNKEKLEKMFFADPEIKTGNVNYEYIKKLQATGVTTSELPFVKRKPYKDEKEWRVVHTAKVKMVAYPRYGIEISWIDGVYLSPWMPAPLVQSVKKILKSIDGCSDLRTIHTTLIDNKKWKDVADNSKP